MKLYLTLMYSMIFVSLLPLFSAENISESEERASRFFKIVGQLPLELVEEFTFKICNGKELCDSYYSPQLCNLWLADEIHNSLYLDGDLNSEHKAFSEKYTQSMMRRTIIKKSIITKKSFYDYIVEEWKKEWKKDAHNRHSYFPPITIGILREFFLKTPFLGLKYNNISDENKDNYDVKKNFVMKQASLERDFNKNAINFEYFLSDKYYNLHPLDLPEIGIHESDELSRKMIIEHRDQIYSLIIKKLKLLTMGRAHYNAIYIAYYDKQTKGDLSFLRWVANRLLNDGYASENDSFSLRLLKNRLPHDDNADLKKYHQELVFRDCLYNRLPFKKD